MTNPKFHTYEQKSTFDSPWSLGMRWRILIWQICWNLFCSWTPKPLNSWRLIWLKLFGVKIYGKPFVHQRSRIHIPWHLILHDQACIGDRTNLYSQGLIEVKARATVAQEAYICTGSHDLSQPHLPLITANITIGEDVFIAARAFVLPGITIGDGAVIGACSVVTKDVEPWSVMVGNPAHKIKERDKKVLDQYISAKGSNHNLRSLNSSTLEQEAAG